MEIFKKAIGWVLLFGGLAIILFALFSSYGIFTGEKAVPQLFEVPEKVLSEKKETSLFDLEGQMGDIVSQQLEGMIPLDFLPKLFNLIGWTMLAGILTFGGFQISNLGIKLIKK